METDRDWAKRDKFAEIKEIFKVEGIKKREKLQKAIQDIEGDKKKKKIKPTIPGKKTSKNGYSGIDNDNPGPAGYNPKGDFVRSKS